MAVIVVAWGARALRVVVTFSIVARFAIAAWRGYTWCGRLLTFDRRDGSRHVEVEE
jgi:hypothetical protein